MEKAAAYDRNWDQYNRLINPQKGRNGNNSGYRFRFPTSSKGSGSRSDPIEIDALTVEQRKLMQEGKCFYCKEQGHISRECPKKMKDEIPETTTYDKDRTRTKGTITRTTLRKRSPLGKLDYTSNT